MAEAQKTDLREAMSISIGSTAGGGVFAVLGLAADLAKGGTPISFLIALPTSYSYTKLPLAYPDRTCTLCSLS